jgi:lysozyme
MNIEAMKRELIRDEGMKLKPYYCPAGKLTIGVGRNLEANGITEVEAEMLLAFDIEKFGAQLDRAIPWWRGLDEVRQRVLLNMAFNLGTAKLMEFQTTLGHVRAGKWDEAANAMLKSKWAGQVGARAVRLAKMMRTGESV